MIADVYKAWDQPTTRRSVRITGLYYVRSQLNIANAPHCTHSELSVSPKLQRKVPIL